MRHVATSDALTLTVHELTPAGAQRVIAAHATGFNALVWRPLVAHLADAHVIAPDLRGHGQSPVPDAYPFDWERYADDVLDSLDAFGWLEGPEPVGIGHSMGGAALLLAELRRPGTFAALWVFEPIVFPPEIRRQAATAENPLSAGARRRRPEFPSRDAAIQTYGSKPPMDVFTSEALEAYVEGGFSVAEDGTARLRCKPADEAVIYQTASTCTAFERLDQIRCTVQVWRGSPSIPGPAALAPAVAEAVPDGTLVTDESLGHFGPMQAPERLATSIDALLER